MKEKRDYQAWARADRELAEAAAMPMDEVNRKHKAWADPVRLLMGEADRAVKMVRKAYHQHLEKKPDRFTLALHVWQEANLSKDEIKGLINQSENGDPRADRILSLLACVPLLKRNASPIEIWLFSILEKRAMRGMKGRPSDSWRDGFIAEIVDVLRDMYPGLLAQRNAGERDNNPPTSACAIVAKALGLHEGTVENIYLSQRTDK